jgi:hypothetical protein
VFAAVKLAPSAASLRAGVISRLRPSACPPPTSADHIAALAAAIERWDVTRIEDLLAP